MSHARPQQERPAVAPPDPAREHQPALSVWPAGLALGITLIAASFVTHPAFAVLGAVAGIAALAAWIAELCRE